MNSVIEKDFSHLTFVDEQEQLYFAEAQLGHETIDFLHSPVGRLLHGRAKQIVDQAKADLLDINPTTRRGFRRFTKIQTEARQAKWFMQWIADAIEQGKAAAAQIDFYRSET